MIKNKNFIAISAIILSAAFIRLLPHAPNFTPLGAMALFAGAYVSNRYLAFALPLVTLLISDALMGFSGWMFPEQIAIVYGSFLMITVLGKTMLQNKKVLNIAVGSLASSVLFFITTNFGVWAGGFIHQPALYPLNGAGLIESYVAAIPFFHNTLFSDLFYNAVFFGSFYLLKINIPSLAEEKI